MIFALVFIFTVTLDTPSDDRVVIVSIHFISFIFLYIFSVMSESMSSGLVPGYTVDIAMIPRSIDGDDSLGIAIADRSPITITRRTIRYEIRYFRTQNPRNPDST